jgi:hypothetical protein
LFFRSFVCLQRLTAALLRFCVACFSPSQTFFSPKKLISIDAAQRRRRTRVVATPRRRSSGDNSYYHYYQYYYYY